MVIDNFYILSVLTLPAEADTPLVVYTDAVLPNAAAFEGFEMIAWRHHQITQLS